MMNILITNLIVRRTSMVINEERNELILQSNNEFSPTMLDFEEK